MKDTTNNMYMLKYSIETNPPKISESHFLAENNDEATVFAQQYINDLKADYGCDIKIVSLHEMIEVDTNSIDNLYNFDPNAVEAINEDAWNNAWYNSTLIALFNNPHDACGKTTTRIIKNGDDLFMRRTSSFMGDTEDVYCKISEDFTRQTLEYHINNTSVTGGISPDAFAYITAKSIEHYFRKNNLLDVHRLIRNTKM